MPSVTVCSRQVLDNVFSLCGCPEWPFEPNPSAVNMTIFSYWIVFQYFSQFIGKLGKKEFELASCKSYVVELQNFPYLSLFVSFFFSISLTFGNSPLLHYKCHVGLYLLFVTDQCFAISAEGIAQRLWWTHYTKSNFLTF